MLVFRQWEFWFCFPGFTCSQRAFLKQNHYNLQKDGPKGAQKQKYYTNSNNLNHENIQGETAEQKEIKVSFGKTYSPCCCCRADACFGPLVSGENHPGYRSQHQCRCSYTGTCATSPFGCSEEEPQYSHAWLDSAEAASLWGQPCMQSSPPPSFSKGSFLSSPPPH